eukprot:COSAG05_NODE_18896_length_301_cov_0.623762_2_plen_47_part_01
MHDLDLPTFLLDHQLTTESLHTRRTYSVEPAPARSLARNAATSRSRR